jgi:proline iminopeptidase
MNAFFPDVRPLARNRTVIFYDQRGGGRSTLPADTSLLHARYFVEDLEAVRRHFELERMNLLAHSFGAVLAARYAENYPERVARMIFVGSIGPTRVEAARAARESSKQMDSTTRRRMSETLVPLLEGTAEDAVAVCREYERLLDSMAVARDRAGQWQGSTCDAPPEAVQYYYQYTAQTTPTMFGAWDFTESFRRVRAPLLVIYGAYAEEPVRVQQRAWATAAANGRVLVVPDAGKGALSDRPELVFPAIAMFLEGQWPDGAVSPGRRE